MQVNDIMTTEVQCVEPETSVEEAARLMLLMNIGSVLVCEQNELLGIVTDRDIVIRCVADGKHPANTAVRDVMTSRLFFCYEEEDVEEAAFRMRDKQVRRLPVLNGDRQLTGILSLGDVALESGNEKMTGETLEAVSESDRYHRCNVLLAEE
jgi:CBS domain-containing protein